jgi:uncharacterized cupredoxin-like copper-binding protein
LAIKQQLQKEIPNMKILSAIVVATTILIGTTSAFAATATPPIKVQVSLEGEGGSPMKVGLDVATVKAGMVEFDVANNAIATDHEVVLIKLKKKGQVITADAKTHRFDESKFNSMGEVAGLKPSATGVLKVKLPAGNYVLVCNHASHLELGMATPFTVTN